MTPSSHAMKPSTESSSPQVATASSSRLVVTLVHGTWARNAEWTRDDRPLSCALRGLGEIKIERLPWSGWNRFTARSAGKVKLQRLIDQSGEDARHFIIAHSHGGNLAHDAVEGREHRVLGVVCLNTPFFVALGRETSFMFEAVVMYIGVIVMWLSFGLWAAYSWPGVAAAGLLMGFAIVMSLVSKPLEAWISRRGELVRRKLTAPALTTTRILCLTTPEDEAFGVLNFVETLSNLPFLLMGRTLLPIGWAVVLVLMGVGTLPVLSGPWELWAAAGGAVVPGWPRLVLFAGSSFFYPGLFFLAAFVAALVSSLILVVVPYGTWQFPDSNLFLRVITSLVPVASRFVEFRERSVVGEGMRHSLLYEDPDTIALVVDWMKSVMATPAGGVK